MASKIEFAVEMTCDFCVKKIKECLQGVDGIINADIQLSNQTVVVETTLPVEKVQSLLISTGRKTIIKGSASLLAAVSVIESKSPLIQGVVRFMKNDNVCIIDGTIDGLKPIPHSLCVFQLGDISNGCESVGSFYEPETEDGKQTNSTLGTFTPEENGRAIFRFVNNLTLYDVIGRSVVIIDSDKDLERGNKIACGIIARSAGLFQNPKMICACDGVSIWDEKTKPKSPL